MLQRESRGLRQKDMDTVAVTIDANVAGMARDGSADGEEIDDDDDDDNDIEDEDADADDDGDEGGGDLDDDDTSAFGEPR